MSRQLSAAICWAWVLFSGCYAPLKSPGMRACLLPDEFRMPVKSSGVPLNYATLSLPMPAEHLLGRDDLLRVEIANFVSSVRPPAGENVRAARDRVLTPYAVDARVSGRGEIILPLVGAVAVQGLSIAEAHEAIAKAYSAGFIDDPQISVSLFQKSTTSVMVLGAVARPDVYELPRDQSDIAHALSKSGGLNDDAGAWIEVHRRGAPLPGAGFESSGSLLLQAGADQLATTPVLQVPTSGSRGGVVSGDQTPILRIPLRTALPMNLTPNQVRLNDGDVVVVPSRTNEVFYVVGKLSPTNLVRFSLGKENRDLGAGFILPRDRDVDVVTAVAMAGYIDPIDSPTTVTVHRTTPDGTPMLVHVDLIAARFDRKENIMVQAGDIIYLNPDAPWWFRRTLDRVLPDLISFPYERSVLKMFGQSRR